jgi:methyl-accepting chemotaxis protein
LREDVERQRQELIRTHSELQQLQQQNRRLATVNAMTAAESSEEATKRINALIAQVDRAINALRG